MGANLAQEMEAHYSTFIVSDNYPCRRPFCGPCLDRKGFRRHSRFVQLRVSFKQMFTCDINSAAGLNWVRIPIGFWAIETINDEPFLVGTSWKYFLKAYVEMISVVFVRLIYCFQYTMGAKIWYSYLPRFTCSSRKSERMGMSCSYQAGSCFTIWSFHRIILEKVIVFLIWLKRIHWHNVLY